MKSRLGSTIPCLAALFGTLGVTQAAFAQAPAPTAQPAPAAPTAQPAPAPAPAPAPPPPAGQPAQNPAYAPPPGYKLVPDQPPPAQYPPQYAPQPPPELPYSDGQTIPPGYRVVERSRRGLIIAGAVVTGVAWSFSVTAAVAADYEDNSGFLLLPVLGPWLMLATGGADDSACTAGEDVELCQSNAGLRAILVLDGLVQTAGGVMFVLGIANPAKRLVRDDMAVRVVPMKLGRDGNGLGVVGTF